MVLRLDHDSDLNERWHPMDFHAEQSRLCKSPARFKVVPAGRRSGKTERAKRQVVKAALSATGPSPAFFCAAPVRDQAKRIYWDDLKLLVGNRYMQRRPSESELTIWTVNGAKIVVIGMDRPERIEGTPWNGGILDEYGNMKEQAWMENVRPALADRMGWCWLIGVPEGRNHYYDRYRYAKGEGNITNGGEWDAFTWFSSDILTPEEIAAARADLDLLTFQQEYEASFVNFTGQCYYPFDEKIHCAKLRDRYSPTKDLTFCFDFNVDPGVAVITQEMNFPRQILPIKGLKVGDKTMFANTITDASPRGTAAIGEVHIPRNSNTRAVCRKLIHDWGDHQGKILVYGDATGGGRSTTSEQVGENDWDIVKNELFGYFGNQRVHMRVPNSNPTERSRVNAVNTRLRTGDETVRLMMDPATCPALVRDFEGVRLLEGGSGEIDKKADPKLTHLTDAFGYYIQSEFPVRIEMFSIRELRA